MKPPLVISNVNITKDKVKKVNNTQSSELKR